MATLFCFLSKEVREAIRRKYRRYSVKRSALAGASTNGLSKVFSSFKGRRRSTGRSNGKQQTKNSVSSQENSVADNVPHWQRFIRKASLYLKGTQKKKRGSVVHSFESSSGRKEGIVLHTICVQDTARQSTRQISTV